MTSLCRLFSVALVVGFVASGCGAPRLYVQHDDVSIPIVEVRLDAVVLGTVAYGEETSFEIAPGVHELELCGVEGGARVWPSGDGPVPLTVEQDLRITLHPQRGTPLGAEPDDE
jgi:hypothetical protein